MVVYALLRRPLGRFKGKLALLLSLEALFIAGISYQTVSIFLVKVSPSRPAGIFYALIVAEALIISSGMLIFSGPAPSLAGDGNPDRFIRRAGRLFRACARKALQELDFPQFRDAPHFHPLHHKNMPAWSKLAP